MEAIKSSLGISGIQTEVSAFRSQGTKGQSGIQIDMLIDRSDQCINLCEMKFYNGEITLNKEDSNKLRTRRAQFQEITKTRKSLFNTLVTTYGITQNEYSLEQVDQIVTMDTLFLLESFS